MRPARTNSEARDRYTHYLQRSLSCVSKTAIWVTGPTPLGKRGHLSLTTQPDPVPLTRSAGRLYLSASQSFHFRPNPAARGQMKVSTDEYIYNLGESPDDPRDYLLAWHWHPSVKSECHLHIRATVGKDVDLHKSHLPTARVSLEEVLRFLIQECGVRPARSDWESVLRDSQSRHETYRTWSGARP